MAESELVLIADLRLELHLLSEAMLAVVDSILHLFGIPWWLGERACQIDWWDRALMEECDGSGDLLRRHVADVLMGIYERNMLLYVNRNQEKVIGIGE